MMRNPPPDPLVPAHEERADAMDTEPIHPSDLDVGPPSRVGPGEDRRTFTSDVTVNEVLGYIGLAVSSVLTLWIVAAVIRDGVV